MTDVIEFDPVDRLAAGALGPPGRRTFLIQASRGQERVTVLVEKEQVALLAAWLLALLAEIDSDFPEDPGEVERSLSAPSPVEEPADPLFRARMMRVAFEPDRRLVVIELFEDAPEGEGDDVDFEHDDDLGWRVRLYATRSQVRSMAAAGAEAVASGRPICRLCLLPIDPEGHLCPSRN